MRFNIPALIIGSLVLTACGVEGDIEDALEAGQCRKAEQLVIDEYSGQKQLYRRAMIYIDCDKNKSQGVKILKKLADGDYLPALERLIEYDIATSKEQRRYRDLKAAAARARYEREKAISESMQRLACNPAIGGGGCSGSSSGTTTSAPKQLDNNKCIQDGGTLMCYDRQSQRYGNY